MPRNLFSPAAFNPFFMWVDFATKSSEMLVSSGQVIASRVDQMARAGVNPSASDRKEFALMGSEKMRAATESGLAVASGLRDVNYPLAMRAWQQSFAAWGAMVSLGGSRTWGEALSRQTTLAHALARSGQTQARLSGSAARLAHAALAPVHAASTGNARRLARSKARSGAARR